ncbi:MAG TPA: DHA2 family efflux MFS transporter permease subunit [Candidatus Binataceae bacterium]|jgi:DHA2 family multidrug resistance protein|nr:DHA2 family efflux MFS transporter permease subunit [Candidatus Binataceae bacterium]
MVASSLSNTPRADEYHPHKWLVAGAVMLGAFLTVLDSSIVNVALPYMQGSFAASVDEITWVVTSYLVASGVMIPMTGWVAARLGRKRYFLFSVTMFVAASGLCGVAQSLGQMVVFRLLQGAAGAAMMPLSQAILLETFPPAEHTLAMSTWGIGILVGPILGPTLGGWITTHWSWRWNFYINLPAGALTLLMVSSFVHDPAHLRERRGRGRVDYLGIALLVAAIGLLQIVLDRGQRSDWFAAPWVRYFTAGSALAAVALTIHELRCAEPILDLRVFRYFSFVLGVLLTAAQSFVIFGINLLNPLFTQELMGYDAWMSGLAVAPRGLGAIVALVSIGQISRRGVDTRPFVVGGFLIAGWAAFRMADWDLSVGMLNLLVPILIFGFGLGSVFPALTAASLTEIPAARMGFASSLFNMVITTAAAFGVSTVSNMLTAQEQVHQTYLVQHFSIFDAWRISRDHLAMPGAPRFDYLNQIISGQHQQLGMLYGSLQAQAWLLAYNDIYRMMAIVLVFVAPWCFLLHRSGAGGGSVMSH